MAWLEIPHELRRAMRVRAKGSIRIHCGNRVVPGRMVDIAVGGVCARTEFRIDLAGLVGEPVRIELRLDGGASRHFAMRGRVLRVNIAVRCIAVEFDAVPDGFEDCIQDELLAAVQHDTLPRMVLVDTVDTRRNHIASAFRNAGCHVTEVSTPLEAIAYLGGARFEPGLIAIADTVPETVAEQLREFLLAEHPGAHMVAIGRSAVHRYPSDSWLSPTNVRGDLQTRVGRVMTAHGSRRRSTMSTRASW